MVAYAIDAIPYCVSMLGHGYVAGSCRCEISCNTQDCSGFIVAGSRSAGLACPCISSAGFAVWGREAGTLISEQEALHTPMAVAIKGPNGGENGNGPLGHIVWLVGDGVHTYEAMGRRYGIVVGNAIGRGFVRWMKVPGLVYGPKITPQRERDMILHPGKPSTVPGQDAYFIVSADGKSIEGYNGASLYNDQPTGNPHMRRWVPAKLGGNKLVGATLRKADAEFDHPGIAAADNTGQMHRGRLS